MSHTELLAPQDILITQQLIARRPRDTELDSELDAYRELSSLMAVDPELAIQRFMELAMQLCPSAGSAGLSELAESGDGTIYFRWTAMSGAYASYVGRTTPRDFSPCGMCLDRHHTVLVERPGRVFNYLNDTAPAIVEGLIVPLYDTGGLPLGTLWITSHENDGHFDATDARVMEQLAVQLVLAIKLRRKAQVVARLEEVVKDRDVLVQEVHHRVKNTIQMTSALLHLQQRNTKSTEAKIALKDAQARLMVLAKVYEALLQPVPDGDAGSVDVGALLDVVVSSLREDAPGSGRVELRIFCDAIRLDVARAVPIGLIVNEAVTNALKYAFPDERRGKVNIELRTSDDTCSVIIADDGCGFESPPRDGSLGMRLIQTLSRQLRAKLEVTGVAGTRISLVFPLTRAQAGSATQPSSSAIERLPPGARETSAATSRSMNGYQS